MRRTCLALLPCLLMAAPALGEDAAPAVPTSGGELLALDLKDLMAIPVRAASGFDQDRAEAPSFVTVLSRDELRAFGHRTLADALAGVTGLYVTYDRTYHAVGVRGFNRPGDFNTRVLVLVDGLRVNDPIYNQGHIGNDLPIDLDLVERVEVVRGPSSSLYGSSAFLAVINVVTRNAADVAHGELAASVGRFGALGASLSGAHVFGEKGSVLVSGTLWNREGADLHFPRFDAPATNGGMAEGRDGERVGSAFLLGRYGHWSVEAAHADRRKSDPTAAWGTIFNDPATSNRDIYTLVAGSWDGPVARDWDVTARVGYQRYQYQGRFAYGGTGADGTFTRSVARDDEVSDTVHGEARVATTAIPRNRLTLGTEVQGTARVRLRYFNGDSVALDRSTWRVHSGFYLLDEVRPWSWLVLNAGVRVDWIEPGTTWDVSPRVALIFRPHRTTAIKVMYGEAFRAPNEYELSYSDGEASKANPDLRPEKIRTYELVLEQRVARWLRLDVAGYYYEARRLITQVVDPADDLLVFRNVDSAKAAGVDVQAIAEFEMGLKARTSFSYCYTRDGGTGGRLSNSPEFMVKFNLSAPLGTPRVLAGVELQWMSERFTEARERVKGHVLLNASVLARDVAPDLDLTLTATNVLDTRYAHPSGAEIEGGQVAQDGVDVRFAAKYRF